MGEGIRSSQPHAGRRNPLLMRSYWDQITRRHAAMGIKSSLLRVHRQAGLHDSNYYRYLNGGDMAFKTAKTVWDMLSHIEQNDARIIKRNKKKAARLLARSQQSQLPKTNRESRDYAKSKRRKSGKYSR